MKIGIGKKLVLVSLSAAEHAVLDAPRALVTFEVNNPKQWMKLTGSHRPGTGYAIGPQQDKEFPHRLHAMRGAAMPMFTTEVVESWSPGKGVLFGHKPRMERPPRSRSGRTTPEPISSMPGLAELRQAVRIINNAKEVYGEQLEITVSSSGLQIRILVEI